jgi:hypothetical protein
VWWKTKRLSWGKYTPRIHWVVWGTGTPKENFTFSPPMSIDQSCVTLSPFWASVIMSLRVPRNPPETRHLTDVWDFHSVSSQPDTSILPFKVYTIKDMFAPCTVTDTDPVASQFCRRERLKDGMSTDQSWVTLPFRSPTVITTLRVPRTVKTEVWGLTEVHEHRKEC